MPVPTPYVSPGVDITNTVAKIASMEHLRKQNENLDLTNAYNKEIKPLEIEEKKQAIEQNSLLRPLQLEKGQLEVEEAKNKNTIATMDAKLKILEEVDNMHKYILDASESPEALRRYDEIVDYVAKSNPNSLQYFLPKDKLINKDGTINRDLVEKQHKFISTLTHRAPTSKDIEMLTIYNEDTGQTARIPNVKGSILQPDKTFGKGWTLKNPGKDTEKEDKIKPDSPTVAIDRAQIELGLSGKGEGDPSVYVQPYYESAANNSTEYLVKMQPTRLGIKSDRIDPYTYKKYKLPKIGGRQVTMADVRASVNAGRGSYQEVIDALVAMGDKPKAGKK